MKKHQGDGKCPEQYLPKAPRALIKHYEARQSFPGREILGRLLTDQCMNRAWSYLHKHINTNNKWEELWSEIHYAIHRARKDQQQHPPNVRAATKKKSELLNIAKSADNLANAIIDGPLDKLCYEIFPEEVIRINGIKNWKQLNTLERSAAASQILVEWPTAPELLRELSERAKQLANESVTKKNRIKRTTRDRDIRYFSNMMCSYLRSQYSTPLYGSVANIASVVFGRTISKKLVENAAKPSQ